MKIKISVICIIMLCLAACANTDTAMEKTIYAMDTVMTLKAYGKNAQTAVDEAQEKIMQLDKTLDRNNEESEIYAINSSGSAEVSDETAQLIRDALDICQSVNGSFDISIAPIMDLWGFYTRDYRVPSVDEMNEALKTVNWQYVSVNKNTVSVKNNAKLDLGGIAKGYTSSIVAEIFEEQNVSGIMSLGGNVQAVGKKSDGSDWKIGIQDPSDSGYIGVVSVSDTAVVTSGGYQRYFEKDGKTYHHIIDPKTGFPADSGLESVTIVCPNGTRADGLSTALFVMGLEDGSRYWRENKDFDVIFYTTDDEIYITEGIKDIFESQKNFNVIEG